MGDNRRTARCNGKYARIGNIQVSKKLTIIILIISLDIFIASLFALAFICYDEKYHDGSISLTIFYDVLAYKYKNDPAVIDISNICMDKKDIIQCIYNNIPFTYDNDRDNRTIMIPKDFMDLEGKGICRDISLIRLAVLRKLGVKSTIVVEPRHVFVRAFEGDKVYELNNEFFVEY